MGRKHTHNTHTHLRDSSRVPRRRPFMKPPYAIGSVPSLSGHAIAYRWRSLPRVRRHRASKPQGSSERVLPWQITMDQLIFASLSHTHCWYEVGMLKSGTREAGSTVAESLVVPYRVGTHQIWRRRRAARSSMSQGRAKPLCSRITGLNREVSEGKADV